MSSVTTLDLIKLALREDMPDGDVTTESLAVRPRQGECILRAKSDLVLSGCDPFEQTMTFLEPQAKFKWLFTDGDVVFKNQTICSIEGDLIQILKAERVALNFLGRLSGIATLTREYTKAVAGSKTQIFFRKGLTP